MFRLFPVKTRNISEKGCKENQNTHFMFHNVFSRKLCRLRCGKNMAEPDRPQTTLWRVRLACWLTKATDIHSEYVIFLSFIFTIPKCLQHKLKTKNIKHNRLIVFIQLYNIGLHVSTSNWPSSGPHINIDPDIQCLMRCGIPTFTDKNIYNMVYVFICESWGSHNALNIVCLDLYYYEGLKMAH